MVPAGLDRLSFDLYDSRQGRHFEVTEVQAAFEVIRPKLKPHQRMVLVPGQVLTCHSFRSSHLGTLADATAAFEQLIVLQLDLY